MGSSQSSHANAIASNEVKGGGVRGRKTTSENVELSIDDQTPILVNLDGEEQEVLDETDDESSLQESDDEEEEEVGEKFDEYLTDKCHILEDAIKLKALAVNFAHPELSVVTTDANAFGRNYFNRASAPEQETFEEAEERAHILADTVALKKLAVDYAHPELSVVTTDANAFGRNYFSRASAPEQETFEEAEERAHILADTVALKKLAVDYAHPELSVVTTDANAFGRNYFYRPSASLQEKIVTDVQKGVRLKVVNKTATVTKMVPGTGVSNDGDIIRSPSSVMLFGYEENQAF